MFNGIRRMLPDRGNLAFEYNPLKNYRSSLDLYESDALGRIGSQVDGVFTQAVIDYEKILTEAGIDISHIVLPNPSVIYLTESNLYGIIQNNTIFRELSLMTSHIVAADFWFSWNFDGMHSDDITSKLQLETQTSGDPAIKLITVSARAGKLTDFDTPLL